MIREAGVMNRFSMLGMSTVENFIIEIMKEISKSQIHNFNIFDTVFSSDYNYTFALNAV